MLDIVIDFETHYEGTYSLRHMPPAQYIRDSRFRVLGAAIALPGKPARYIEPPALDKALAGLPWYRLRLVAHNASFDAAVLSMHYGYRPAAYACTMLQARYLIAQGEIDARTGTSLDALAALVGMTKGNLEEATATGQLATYAALDAEICRALHERHAPAIPEAEMDYMDLHVRMAAEPVLELDQNRLSKIANSEKSLEKLFPIVRKDDTFAAALSALGVPPMYKTTAKGTYKLATAKTDNWLASLDNHANPKVRLLASVRRKASSTIERSRAQRFIDVGSPLPVPLLYYAAHTGRSGGQDKINLQNLPRKDGLRQCILAPPGHKLVIVDSAQIEVRVLAYLAEQEDLLEDFRQDRDPYISFACNSLYQRWSYEEMTALVQSGGAAKKEGRPLSADEKQAGDDRQIAKAAVLALGFGQGVNGFVGYCEGYNIPMDEETAARIVSTYRRTYQAISGGDAPPYRSRRGYWWQCEQQVRRNGFTELPSGRKLTYPNLRVGEDGLEYRRHAIFAKAKNEGHSNLWHGKLVENTVQAAARDVVFHQTRRLHRQGWRVVLMVHDEAVLCVPEDKAEEALRAAEVSFGSTPPWAPGLPVKGEGSIVERYGK